jgi:hypothetical protein
MEVLEDQDGRRLARELRDQRRDAVVRRPAVRGDPRQLDAERLENVKERPERPWVEQPLTRTP